MLNVKKIINSIIFLIWIVVLNACSTSSGNKDDVALENAKSLVQAKEDSLWRTCSFPGNDFAFTIDSCNCDEIYSRGDSVFVELFPAAGGEVQERLLKINMPACDTGCLLLMKYQNRYAISSMGPDPVLLDWMLYHSATDSIRYDPLKKGFYIAAISPEDQSRFPKFDTLDFFNAYKRAVDDNLRSDDFPGNSKNALHEEYKRNRQDLKDLLMRSGAELHRIILDLRKPGATGKVIIFTYGHFG